MKNMSSLTAFSIFILFVLGNIGDACIAKDIQSKLELCAQVQLQSGSTRQVANVRGIVTCTTDDGATFRIPFENIRKLESFKEGSTITISLLGAESIIGKPEPFTIQGESDFGFSNFRSQDIVAVIFTNNTPKTQTINNGLHAEVHMIRGNTNKIENIRSWHAIKCADGDFSYELSFNRIKKLDILDDETRIYAQLLNGAVFTSKIALARQDIEQLKRRLNINNTASQKAPFFRLEGQVAFGSLVINSSDIQSVLFSGHPRDEREVTQGVELSLTSAGDSKLKGRVTDLTLGLFAFELNANNITGLIFPTEKNRVLIQTSSVKAHTFTFGAPDLEKQVITGTFAGGTFKIPYSKIATMTLEKAAQNDRPTASKTIESSLPLALFTVEDMLGNRIEATDVKATIGFGSQAFDIYFPHGGGVQKENLTVVNVGPVRYLLDPDTILQDGLQLTNGTVSLSISGRTIFSYVIKNHDSASIHGKTEYGAFTIPAKKIKSIVVPQKMTDRAPFYGTSEADATVKTTNGDVFYIKDPILNAENTIRSGYYLRGGGRLYRHSSRTLSVKNEIGESVAVQFTKIRSLIVDNNYRSNKKVRLISKSGQEMTGNINLEALMESKDSNYLSDEGIIGCLSRTVYIFIPFNEIDSITFKSE